MNYYNISCENGPFTNTLRMDLIHVKKVKEKSDFDRPWYSLLTNLISNESLKTRCEENCNKN